MRPGPLPKEPEELVDLITSCWQTFPEHRPTMHEVSRIIESIKKEM